MHQHARKLRPGAGAAAARPADEVATLHDAVPGRLRLAVPKLKGQADLGRCVEAGLAGAPGVLSARANSVTGSLLVCFEPGMAADEIRAHVRRALTHPLPANDPRPNLPVPQGRAPQLAASDGDGWHCLPEHDLFARVGSCGQGLSEREAANALQRFGPNVVAPVPPRSGLAIFLEQFKSLPVAMLGAAAGLSLFTGGLADAAVILGVVVINAVIGYTTESQAERTIRGLSDAVRPTARVLRGGTAQVIDGANVAVGDVLMLSPGQFVAADARVIESRDLTVNESVLTGESMPVLKSPMVILRRDTALADRHNMVYKGTVVTGGAGLAVVVATGPRTEVAGIQALLASTQQPDTPMQRQLDRLGNQLVWMSAGICAVVFGLGLLRGYGLIPMLQSAISLAVAALPEGLPTVATTTLALGVKDMRANNVLVRRITAVESLGSVSIICFDKTGTLTMNRMSVVQVRGGGRVCEVRDRRFHVDDQVIEPRGDLDLRMLLRVVALCSEAELDADSGLPCGSATEAALVQAALDAGIDVRDLRKRQPQLELVPRTEQRKYMTTVHDGNGGSRLIAVKGSPSEVLALCGTCQMQGREVPLGDAERAAILADNEDMAASALRVLGVAFRKTRADETGDGHLVWLGLIGMADPVRHGMKELMGEFHGAGIDTAMITGDQGATAYAIAKDLSLGRNGHVEILDSGDLASLDPEVLATLAAGTNVFARVSPGQKLRIVQALQSGGKVVAMTGDGVNDSPALKAADIGIAMGTGGTDVARDAADIVLEDDNLATMAVAVARGRTIYSNIRKSIRYLLTTNMSEIEVMLAANVLGMGQPLAPMQLLWINLVTDIFPGLALALEAPAPDVLSQPPRDPTEPIVRKRALSGMLAESTALTTGSLTAYGVGLARYGMGPQANTMAFTSLVTAQLLHAITCRTEHGGWAARRNLPRNPWLTWAIAGSFAAQIGLMAIPGVRRLFGLAPIGLADLVVSIAGGVLPVLAIDMAKSLSHTPATASEAPILEEEVIP